MRLVLLTKVNFYSNDNQMSLSNLYQKFNCCCKKITTNLIISCSEYFHVITLATLLTTYAQLTPDFYNNVCPEALPIIKSVVQRAIFRERRIGASLLRLHFHDCFVNVSYISLTCMLSWEFFLTNISMHAVIFPTTFSNPLYKMYKVV